MKRRQNEREKGRRVENSEDGRRRRTVRYRPRVEHGERQRTRKTRNEIRERQMGREADGERGWQGGNGRVHTSLYLVFMPNWQNISNLKNLNTNAKGTV